MEMTTVKGIVIRERQSGDNDKFMDILTDRYGLIEVMAKGAKKMTCKYAAASQLFAYSTFCLNKKREMFYVNSAEPIKIFYKVRSDLDKLSLASYFSEVISYAQLPDESNKEEVLRLLLNIFHFLSEGSRETSLLKSIFEMRFMAETGHMPSVIGCSVCNLYTDEKMYFNIDDGTLQCSSCYMSNSHNSVVCISAPVLHAIRYIVLTDFDRLFNFRLKGESMLELSYISEKYLTVHLGRYFRTLDFYKSIIK